MDLKKSIETNQSIKQSDLAKKHKVNILSFTILANSGLIRNIGTTKIPKYEWITIHPNVNMASKLIAKVSVLQQSYYNASKTKVLKKKTTTIRRNKELVNIDEYNKLSENDKKIFKLLVDIKNKLKTNGNLSLSGICSEYQVNRIIGTKINSLGYVKNVGNHIKTNYKWNTGDVNIQMVFALKEAVKDANLKLKNAPKVNTVESNIIQKKSEVKSETETPVIEKLFAFTKQNSIQNYTMTIPLFWGLIKLNVNIKNK
ncbi:hypothetical protein [Elizabethkingia bruuniana]|uniref:hypothetical protein n=1 Tax=Elizabethkingia bruuniana TaxID=1756149 RepID=UPI00099B21F8|nr:hypothetical protein [Elizabethkingia bruuniana]OPC53393.1 hypothetical protein BAY07_15175 [Elizabethkingia bruuniana]